MNDCEHLRTIHQNYSYYSSVKGSSNKSVDIITEINVMNQQIKQVMMTINDLIVMFEHPRSEAYIFEQLLTDSEMTDIFGNFVNALLQLITITHSNLLLSKASNPGAKLNTSLINAAKLMFYKLIALTDPKSHVTNDAKKILLYNVLQKSISDTLEAEVTTKNKPSINTESLAETSRIDKLVSILHLLSDLLQVVKPQRDSEGLYRLGSILAALLENFGAPVIVRLASRCAGMVWPYLDCCKISVLGTDNKETSTSEKDKQDCFADAIVEKEGEEGPTHVMLGLLKQIGMKISAEEFKEEAVEVHDELYSVILHVSSNSEDISFLLNILYEWENLYPSFTLKYPTELQKGEEKEPIAVHPEGVQEEAKETIIVSGDESEESGSGRGGMRGKRGGRGRYASGEKKSPRKRIPKSSNPSCVLLSKLEDIYENLLGRTVEIEAKKKRQQEREDKKKKKKEEQEKKLKEEEEAIKKQEEDAKKSAEEAAKGENPEKEGEKSSEAKPEADSEKKEESDQKDSSEAPEENKKEGEEEKDKEKKQEEPVKKEEEEPKNEEKEGEPKKEEKKGEEEPKKEEKKGEEEPKTEEKKGEEELKNEEKKGEEEPKKEEKNEESKEVASEKIAEAKSTEESNAKEAESSSEDEESDEEEDSDEEKIRKLLEDNFHRRILQHIKDAQLIVNNLLTKGIAQVFSPMPHDKAVKLASLFHNKDLVSNRKLPENPHSKQSEKPSENEAKEKQKNLISQGEEMLKNNSGNQKPVYQVSIGRHSVVQKIFTMLESPAGAEQGSDRNSTKNAILSGHINTGIANSMYLLEVIQLIRNIVNEKTGWSQILQDCLKVALGKLSEGNWQDLSRQERLYIVGSLGVLSGWFNNARPGATVQAEVNQSTATGTVLQGSAGKDQATIIFPNDTSFTTHSISKRLVNPRLPNEWLSHFCTDLDAIAKSIVQLNSICQENKGESLTHAEELSYSLVLRLLLKISAELNWVQWLEDKETDSRLLADFVSAVLLISKDCPVDRTLDFWEDEFVESWERILDKLNPNYQVLYIPPVQDDSNDLEQAITRSFSQSVDGKASDKPRPSASFDGVQGCKLPESSFISSLPEAQPTSLGQTPAKMLKYWEKHIIPKIQDFVRSSFRPYEMEYFFEQLRQPLRVGDQNKASEVAYILCDQRLPAGCVIPDSNHDWSAFTTEECVVGQWAVAKLKAKSGAFVSDSPLIVKLASLGVTEICVQIRAVDLVNNQVLVQYVDHDSVAVGSMWLPVSALTTPEVTLSQSATSSTLTTLRSIHQELATSLTSRYARQSLLQFFAAAGGRRGLLSEGSGFGIKLPPSLQLIDIIKWSVWEDLCEDPVEGWLKSRSDSLKVRPTAASARKNGANGVKGPLKQDSFVARYAYNSLSARRKDYHRLEWLEQQINTMAEKHTDSKEMLSELVDWTTKSWGQLEKDVRNGVTQVNLKVKLDEYADLRKKMKLSSSTSSQGSSSLLPLHELVSSKDDSSYSGMVVSFVEDAKVPPNTTLKFFADPLAVSMINQVKAGKEGRGNLNPIVLRQGRIWFTIEEGLANPGDPMFNANYTCKVSFIPSTWSVVCWLTDVLTSALLAKVDEESMEWYRTLVAAMCDFISYSTAPTSMQCLMFKLLSRVLRKIRYFDNLLRIDIPVIEDTITFQHFESRCLDPVWLFGLLTHISTTTDNERRNSQTLTSAYIQDAFELVTSALLPGRVLEHQKTAVSRILVEATVPDWMLAIVHANVMLNFIRGDSSLPRDISNEVDNDLRIDGQWQRIIHVDSIPLEWSVEEVNQRLVESIKTSKARVVDKDLDIWIPTTVSEVVSVEDKEGEAQDADKIQKKHCGQAFILVDCWDITVPDMDEYESRAKEEKPKPEIKEPEFWNCSVCTLENASSNDVCDACESPKPRIEMPVQEDFGEGGFNVEECLRDLEKEFANQLKKNLEDITLAKYKEGIEVRKKKEAEERKAKKQEEANQITDECLEGISAMFEGNPEENKEENSSEEKKKQEGNKEEEKKQENEEEKDKEAPKEGEEKEKKEEGEGEHKEKPEGEEENKEKQSEDAKEEDKPKEDKEDKKEATGDKDAELSEEEELAKVPRCTVTFGLDILAGSSKNYFNQFLKKRLYGSEANAETMKFPDPINEIVSSIFTTAQGLSEEDLRPKVNESLEAYGITAESLKTMDLEVFRECAKLVSGEDCYLLWKLFEELGYDLWLDCARDLTGSQELFDQVSLKELLEFSEVELCNETRFVISLPSSMIRIPEFTTQKFDSKDNGIHHYYNQAATLKYNCLQEQPLKKIRYNWSVLKKFNHYLSDSINFINGIFNEGRLNSHSIPLNIPVLFSEFRGLLTKPILNEMQQRVFEKTAIPRENPPKLTMERLKISQGQTTGTSEVPGLPSGVQTTSVKVNRENRDIRTLTSKRKDEFAFIRAYEQMREINVTQLRPEKPLGTDPFICFEVIFKGEHVVGATGPYRQFLADLSAELQPSVPLNEDGQMLPQNLNLLCPTPNHREKLGNARDKFVVTPSAVSSYHLELYEFLGLLFGCCIRTGVHLTLDLPSFFWKQLSGENLTIADLREIDQGLCEVLEFMETAAKDVFEESIFESFSTYLSDNTLVDLKANGRTTPVNYEDRSEFIRLALQNRFKESAIQMNAIRKGLTQLVPEPLLINVTWQELENWVSGKPTVDVDLLKRHTTYSGKNLTETSPKITWFWEVLHELSEKDKLRFVKFCWGQERLPANDEEFRRTQTRFMVKDTVNESHKDGALPKADTCFFNLELPNYSSRSILKERLLIAINTDCDSMNAENPLNMDPNDAALRQDDPSFSDY